MKINRLYAILAIACFFGYLWLGYSVYVDNVPADAGINMCFFKQATTIPCPSCGTTRSIQLLVQGNIKSAALLNPFGIIVLLGMLIIPPWIIYDIVTKKQTLLRYFKKGEDIIKIKWVTLVLALLVLINWIWNIHKQL